MKTNEEGVFGFGGTWYQRDLGKLAGSNWQNIETAEIGRICQQKSAKEVSNATISQCRCPQSTLLAKFATILPARFLHGTDDSDFVCA
jgi:hypothetical protein